MTRRAVTACLLALLASCAGCAPRLDQLLATRQLDEAVCAAEQASERQRAAAAGILRWLRPALHLHVVTRPELARVLGDDAAKRVLAKVIIVRLRHDSNSVPLAEFDLSLTLDAGDNPMASVALEREALARITGETLPGEVQVTYGPGRAEDTERAARAVAKVGGKLLDAVTLGATSKIQIVRPPSSPSSSGSYMRDPTAAEYRRKAPVTEALYQALQVPYCEQRPGQACDRFFAWSRQAPTGPLALMVETSFSAPGYERDADNETMPRDCRWSHTVRVPLPPGPNVGARISCCFGDRMRYLHELTEGHPETCKARDRGAAAAHARPAAAVPGQRRHRGGGRGRADVELRGA